MGGDPNCATTAPSPAPSPSPPPVATVGQSPCGDGSGGAFSCGMTLSPMEIWKHGARAGLRWRIGGTGSASMVVGMESAGSGVRAVVATFLACRSVEAWLCCSVWMWGRPDLASPRSAAAAAARRVAWLRSSGLQQGQWMVECNSHSLGRHATVGGCFDGDSQRVTFGRWPGGSWPA